MTTQIQVARDWYKEFSELVEKGEPDLNGARRAYEEMTSRFPVPEGTTTERVDAGGVPAEWIVAPGAAADRAFFYFHSSGYAMGSVNTQRAMCARMSRASQARCLSVDYRLAPENPFPAALDDAKAVFSWLLSNGFSAGKIAISGSSAGGGLALAALVALRDAGGPMPAAAVCTSPWVDLACTGESMTTKVDLDPVAKPEMLGEMVKMYIGNGDPKAPLVSPLYADMHGLPPILMHVGTSEVLMDDSRRFADRAKAAGVDATAVVWEEMVHDWQQFAHVLPQGQQSIDQMGAFILKHTS